MDPHLVPKDAISSSNIISVFIFSRKSKAFLSQTHTRRGYRLIPHLDVSYEGHPTLAPIVHVLPPHTHPARQHINPK